MKSFSNTTVIIPTLNEEKNIATIIDKIKEIYPKIKIIVADDGSRDDTQKIARKHGALVIDRSKRKIKGITASIIEALHQVKTENLIVIDADLQHPPEKIEDIIDKLKTCGVVIAVRRSVIGPWGILRKLESKTATILAQLRLLKGIGDPLSGFFGIKTKLFREINKSNFELKCFKILFNILKNLNLKKTRIGYVYYDFNIRKRGESKISSKHVFYFLRNLVK